MRTLHNSLRSLSHPVTLVNIALLILNDHFLKSAHPSWVTGKLSDFAGLFFFPFLLAAALSVAFVHARFSARTIGTMAFGVTGIWFALIKITPWGNSLTQDFLSRVLGFPVQIVLDPTDIIALASLFPAWLLWNRPMSAPRPNRLSWVALVVAVLASLATSPPPPPPFIVGASGVGNALCVLDQKYNKVYESTDGGDRWAVVTRSSCDFQQPTMPKVVCSSSNTQLCYRINKNERVEKSTTGGETWAVAWSIPPARREFMDYYVCGRAACSAIDMGPYDIALAKYNGADIVAVAMGSEGALVLDQRGYWDRKAIAGAYPTPFDTIDPFTAFRLVSNEAMLLVYATVFAFPVLSILSWLIVSLRFMRDNARARLPRTFVPAIGVVAIEAALFGLYNLAPVWGLIGMITKNETYASIFYLVAFIVIPGMVLVGFGLSWHRLSQLLAEPRKVAAALGLIVIAAVTIFPLGWAPLYGWVAGLIDVRQAAVWIAIGLETLLLGVFIFAIAKLGWASARSK